MGEYEILDVSSGDPNQASKKNRKSYWTVFELHELFNDFHPEQQELTPFLELDFHRS